MNLLIVDQDCVGLSFAWRCAQAGHSVKWFISPRPRNNQATGEGFRGIEKVDNWVQHVKWADLIWCTSNDQYIERLENFRTRGFPYFGPSVASANLEIKRADGMKLLERAGIDVVPYQTFKSLKDAYNHVKKTGQRYVFKTLGDNEDKSLTYCSKDAADMMNKIKDWIEKGVSIKGEVMLQEFIKGIEFGVSRWMGKDGWVGQWNESFEHKKLMSGNFGQNTGEMGCYDEETEVLTKSGWKFWRDVVKDDYLATLSDGNLIFENPSELVCYEVDTNMIEWKNQSIDILVTPNHNMYVQKQFTARKNLDNYQFIQAESCLDSQYSIKRTCEWKGNNEVDFALPGNEWKTGKDFSIDRSTDDILVPFGELCSFLGIYFADGCSNENRVTIAKSHKEKFNKIKFLLESTVFWKYTKTSEDYGFNIYCSQLARLTSKFGKSYEKRIPDYIKNSTSENIQLFLDSFIMGDGNTQKNGSIVLYTSNKLLADDLQELLLKTGKLGVIKELKWKEKNSKIGGREIIQRRPAYEIYVRTKKIRSWLDLRDRREVPYKGKVYCATVSSHVLYVRRNGKPVWCGNTVAAFTPESKIGIETLGKLEQHLLDLGHMGDCALGFMVDDSGKPWPTEFTNRPGWPIFNMMLGSIKGDPCEWMLDAYNGKDTTTFSEDIGTCFVMAHGDFPSANMSLEDLSGLPIRGITKGNKQHLHPQSVKIMKKHDMSGDAVIEKPIWCTSNDYVLVVTGFGKDVKQSKDRAFKTLKQLHVSNAIARDDIGEELENQLPELHKHGYATHFNYDTSTQKKKK